ncbi:hypothetical protein CR513_62350, partial [Mucuna pruriens]
MKDLDKLVTDQIANFNKIMDYLKNLEVKLEAEDKALILLGGYETANVLVVSNSEIEKDWVMNSDCTFHMCPRKGYFESLNLKEGGVLLLGNNKSCKVQGMGSIRLKMFNDRESLLSSERVGSIMYGMCNRPDLANSINVVSKFMANPRLAHWGTLKLDFESIMALSTTQARFMALVKGVKGDVWIKGLISELRITQNSVTIFCDSQSAIHLSKHQVYHEKSKHIDVKLHFIRDVIEIKEILVEKVATEENLVDAFTGSLPLFNFKHYLDLIGE